jgi:Immunity protein 63
MKNIQEMRKKFNEIVEGLNAHDSYKVFHESPKHDGSPHVEKIGNEWNFVVTERGSEIERIKSSDPDYILYLLVCCVTHNMATTYELKNRIPGIDGRRIWFEYDINLLQKINKNWGIIKRQEYDKILLKNPFTD